MATQAIDSGKLGWLPRTGHFLLHEFRQILPPTIFFFIGFNLILFTKRLILEDYLIQFTGFFMQLYRPLSSARWSLSLK